MRVRPPFWPLLIGAPVLLFCWIVMAWNLTFGAAWPSLHVLAQKPLVGVQEAAGPALSAASLLNAKWQSAFAHDVAFQAPIWRAAVKARNQLYYSLLDTSPVPTELIGRGRELYGMDYVVEYCARDRTLYEAALARGAPRIARVQAFYRARKTPFLYLITPSKMALYPQYLPAAYPCLSSPEDRAAKLATWRRLLDAQGIDYVDASSLLAQHRDSFGIDLFPERGVHWNALGVALAADAVTEKLNRLAGRRLLTPFRFTWTVSFKPQGMDRDLLDIMNLMVGDGRYPVPVVSYQPPRVMAHDPPGCLRPTITAVGGSFLTGLAFGLGRVACPPHFQLWNYWHTAYWHPDALPDRLDPQPMNADRRMEDLLGGDAVILEENETLIGASEHGHSLEAFVASLDQPN